MLHWGRIVRFFARFWHPVALPEEVVETLGVEVSNFLSFGDLIRCLNSCHCHPPSLAKYMPRKDAETAFKKPTCVEKIGNKTLISYYFNEGWVEFVLHFDTDGRLRRIYLLHKEIEQDEGVEIQLSCSYIGDRFHHGHRLTA